MYSRNEISGSLPFEEIISGFESFIAWKEKVSQITDHKSALQHCPLAKLESSLNQLDLMITSFGSEEALATHQSVISQMLAESVTPLQGEWIWYEDEFTQSFSAKWKSQTDFLEAALPSLLIVCIHWLRYIEKNQGDVTTNITAMKVLESLLCYTINDGSFPWTLPSSNAKQEKLVKALQKITEPFCKNKTVRADIFDQIKPAFISHSTHPSISAAGRKIFTANGAQGPSASSSRNFTFSYLPEDETNTKNKSSWRTRHQYSLTLLEIYIEYSEEQEIRASWSFIIPCVLNIIDDPNPGIKRKGSDLAKKLTVSAGGSFFKQTGVSPVLWSALKPALSYLPPSTPVSISVPLSKSTYEAMMALSYCSKASSHKLQHEYFQEAVLMGISHCHTNTKALINFLSITTDLVLEHMKTYTTPHLRPLIAIITGTLCDPFVTFSPELVSTVCGLAEAVIKTVWFRVFVYRYDILRALVVVSKRIAAEDGSVSATSLDQQNSTTMKRQTNSVLTLLQQAIAVNLDSPEKMSELGNFQKELDTLCEQEPTLLKLMALES